jgi:hypothetical protein
MRWREAGAAARDCRLCVIYCRHPAHRCAAGCTPLRALSLVRGLLSLGFMISSRVCTLFVLLTLSTPIAVAHAQDAATASHVRGTDEASTTLIRDLVARSATGRELVDRLDRSDLVVYVRRRLFTTALLSGRIGFVRGDCNRRYVAIEIAAPRNYVEELASLGHELQHAVEIAGEPDVCGSAALAGLYTRIGDPVERWGGMADTFETRTAAETGVRVRRELLQTAAEN